MADINKATRIDGGVSLDDSVGIFQGSTDPSLGEAAPVGSLYLRTNGQVWQKAGVGDTSWTQLAAGAGVVNISDLGDVSVTSPVDGQLLVYNNGAGEWQNVENYYASNAIVTKEPTGIPDRAETTLTINEGTRTVTLTPTGASFDWYIWGTRYTSSIAISGTFPNTQGMHFFYLDSAGVMQIQTGGFLPALLSDYAYIANVYWDVTNQVAVVFGEERHGITMDYATHSYLHTTVGTQFASGLALADMTVGGTGNSAIDAQFTVSNGQIRDEDITIDIVHDAGGANPATTNFEQILALPAQLPVFWRTGASGDWVKRDADTYPLIYSGDASGFVDGTNGLPAWNEWTGVTWQLTAIPNNHYFLMHIIATNDVRHPIVAIVGTVDYQNKPRGQESASTELTGMSGLPFQEFTPIASVLYDAKTGYTNVPKAAVQADADGNNYVDWRDVGTISSVFAGGGLTDHGNLGGLTDDDHTQYALAGSGSTRTFDLDDLLNVTITTPADTEVLTYSAGTWINSTIPLQNLWETFSADTGSTAANIATDTLTVSGGTGISTSITGDVLTITNTSPNVDQNLFANIAVSGQNTVVADTTTDTLTFIAGTNITITTDDVNDTITINATTGGSQNLFETIAVTDTDSGYTWAATGSAIADTTTDTLTFVSGTGIDIDVDATLDAIRITATGGAGSQNLFETFAVTDTDSGYTWAATGSAIADTTTDTLTWVSGVGIDIDVDATLDAIRVTNTSPNVDQNLWETIAADTGSTAANTTTDTLTVTGGNLISTSITGDTLTIASAPSIFMQHNGAITQTFNTTPTTLLFDTSIRADADYSYTSGVVTINTTADYKIQFEVAYNTTTNPVTTCQTAIYRNGTAITGALTYSYHSSSADGSITAVGTYIINLTATDTIEIVGVRTAGNGSLNTLAESSRLIIERV